MRQFADGLFRHGLEKFHVGLSQLDLLCTRKSGIVRQETEMNIIYAAEKPSIAKLFSQHMQRRVVAEDIQIAENPDETGSFLIGFDLEDYVMAPDGTIQANTPR